MFLVRCAPSARGAHRHVYWSDAIIGMGQYARAEIEARIDA